MKEVREEVAQAEGTEGMKGPGQEVEQGACRRWGQRSCGATGLYKGEAVARWSHGLVRLG